MISATQNSIDYRMLKIIRNYMYILFLDSPSNIDADASFEQIGFTSIDFIDFCYEVKAQISQDIESHDIWPFAQLLVDPLFCSAGRWTEKGKARVNEILGLEADVELDPKSLDKYWTPGFCAHRIETVLNA
jgi:hypothetical protein